MTGEARRRPDPELVEVLLELRGAELEALERLELEACKPVPPRPPNADDLMLGGYLRFVEGRRPRRRRQQPPA